MVYLEMVVGEGFEPSKSMTADLQSAPFGRSGTPPLNSWFLILKYLAVHTQYTGFTFFPGFLASNHLRLKVEYGGGGRIRTFEVDDGRFTVCSLWPLGNPTTGLTA